MEQDNIINNVKEIIYYSNLSQKLRLKQIIYLNLIYKNNNNLLYILPKDIFIYICNLIQRNNWKNTKKILN